MRTETFISFYLNQDGASTYVHMWTYVGLYPCDASCKMRGSCWSMRMCKMMFLTAAQNRCIKSMSKMAHATDSKVRTPEEQFLRKRVFFSKWFHPQKNSFSIFSCWFKVIRSAWLFQLPSLPLRLRCSGDLNFWEFQSRFEHPNWPCKIRKPGKPSPELRSLESEDVNWTLNFQHSRLTLSSKSPKEKVWRGLTANHPSSHWRPKQWPHSHAWIFSKTDANFHWSFQIKSSNPPGYDFRSFEALFLILIIQMAGISGNWSHSSRCGTQRKGSSETQP